MASTPHTHSAATLKVLSAGAVKYVVTDFAEEFTGATGHPVTFTFGTIGEVKKRLDAGETADVIIGTAPAIADLEQAGAIVPGSRASLGRTVTALTVRAGAPAPQVSTPEAFKQALIRASSIAYTDPAAGGTSGLYLTGLIDRLGIAEVVRRKAILCINGDEVVEKVAAGAAELGSTFLSEIVPDKRVMAVGPLPPAIANATSYAAGISTGASDRAAAAAFIDMLVAPARISSWKGYGFEAA
jgi:molybdate transport system substrate-binding protein